MTQKYCIEKEEQRRLFCNLLALGINPAAIEHKYRCQLDENTFDKPNKRAFEVVAHFLFHKLNHKQATELFRNNFPCTDKKTTQEFRKVCYNWLKRIAEENKSFGFPRVNASALMSPGEKEFIHLMFMFSTFVLYQHTLALQPDCTLHHPIVSTSNGRLAQAQLNTSFALTMQEFKDLQKQMQLIKRSDEELQAFSGEQLDTCHALQKRKKYLLQKKSNLMGRNSKVSQMKFAEMERNQRQKLQEKINHARSMWKDISDSVEDTSRHRNVLESVIGGSGKAKKIDGNQLQVNVPAKLNDECQEEVYRIVGTSLYQGGKLNLTSLVALENLSLSLLADHLHEDGLPNFEKQSNWLKIQGKLHEDQLSKLRCLNEGILQESRSKKNSIKNLETTLDSVYQASEDQAKTETTSFGLDVPDSSFPDGVSVSSSLDRTEQWLSRSAISTKDCQHSLIEKSLCPSDEDLQSYLERLVCPSENFPHHNPSSTLRQIEHPHQAWVIKAQDDTPKTSRKKAPSREQKKTDKMSTKSSLTQGKQRRVAFEDRVSSELRKHLASSLTPDGKTTYGKRKTRSNSRKSISLPSSPMIAFDGDVTVERMTSRTPEADQKFIEQIVDSTVQDHNSSPLIVYQQDTKSQLDRSAFVSRDKIQRSPPENNEVTPSPHDQSSSDEAVPETGGNQLSDDSDIESTPFPSCASSQSRNSAWANSNLPRVVVNSASKTDESSLLSPSYCEELQSEEDSNNEGCDVPDSSNSSLASTLRPGKEFPSTLQPPQPDAFPNQPNQGNRAHKDSLNDTLQSYNASSSHHGSSLDPLFTSRGQNSSTSSAMDNALMSLLDGDTPSMLDLSMPSFAELVDVDEEDLVPTTDTLVPLDENVDAVPTKLLEPTKVANPIDLLMSTPPPMGIDEKKENVTAATLSPPIMPVSTSKDSTPARSLLQEFHLNLLPTSETLIQTPELQNFKAIGRYKSKPN